MFFGPRFLQSVFSRQTYIPISTSEKRTDSSNDTIIEVETQSLDSQPSFSTELENWYTPRSAQTWLPDYLLRIISLATLTAGIVMFTIGLRWRIHPDQLCWEKHTAYCASHIRDRTTHEYSI